MRRFHADAFLSDDGDAIKEAQRLGISTVRLFNILESAAELKLLDLPEAVRKIRHTTFRMPPGEIIDAMLDCDQQRKEAEEQARKKSKKQKPRRAKKA